MKYVIDIDGTICKEVIIPDSVGFCGRTQKNFREAFNSTIFNF
jgi:hypothetical protein